MTKTTPPTHLVLYADDDIDDIKFVTDSFAESTQNIELITAYNGLDLLKYLEKLNQLDPDPMPYHSGREYAEAQWKGNSSEDPQHGTFS